MMHCSQCGTATKGYESSPGVTSAICDACRLAMIPRPETARAAARGKSNEEATAEAHALLKQVRSSRSSTPHKKLGKARQSPA